MLVKITNCKFYTGGGDRFSAIPKRLRKNQNLRVTLDDKYKEYNDIELFKIISFMFGRIVGFTSTSKIIRNPISNYVIRYNKRYKNYIK